MAASNTNTGKKQRDPNRPLVIVVISMGIALVGGMALLMTELVSGLNAPSAPAQAGCEPQRYVLAEGETALVLSIDGRMATIEVRAPGPKADIQLRTIDMCSGQVVRELDILHSSSRGGGQASTEHGIHGSLTTLR